MSPAKRLAALRILAPFVLGAMAVAEPAWNGKPLPLAWATVTFVVTALFSHFVFHLTLKKHLSILAYVLFFTGTFTLRGLVQDLWVEERPWDMALVGVVISVPIMGFLASCGWIVMEQIRFYTSKRE